MALSLSKYIGYACKLLLCLSMFCFVDEQKHFIVHLFNFYHISICFAKILLYVSPGMPQKKPGLTSPGKIPFFPGLKPGLSSLMV